nr:unnamed protein product [Spirometra erinaceieuropaei]
MSSSISVHCFLLPRGEFADNCVFDIANICLIASGYALIGDLHVYGHFMALVRVSTSESILERLPFAILPLHLNDDDDDDEEEEEEEEEEDEDEDENEDEDDDDRRI